MKLILIYIALLSLTAFFGDGDARKGNEAYEKGEYAIADSLYRVALGSDPENAKLHFNLGNALAKQGKIEEAIEAYLQFESFSETKTDKSLAQYNIGTLLAETEKWKPAKLHFKNALKMNPGDFEAKHNFELAAQNAQDEENEQQQQQDQNQEQPEPSEYAKAMKKQAEKLIDERQYKQAYDLMQQALQADETVRAFNDFIQRIETVDQIDS